MEFNAHNFISSSYASTISATEWVIAHYFSFANAIKKLFNKKNEKFIYLFFLNLQPFSLDFTHRHSNKGDATAGLFSKQKPPSAVHHSNIQIPTETEIKEMKFFKYPKALKVVDYCGILNIS